MLLEHCEKDCGSRAVKSQTEVCQWMGKRSVEYLQCVKYSINYTQNHNIWLCRQLKVSVLCASLEVSVCDVREDVGFAPSVLSKCKWPKCNSVIIRNRGIDIRYAFISLSPSKYMMFQSNRLGFFSCKISHRWSDFFIFFRPFVQISQHSKMLSTQLKDESVWQVPGVTFPKVYFGCMKITLIHSSSGGMLRLTFSFLSCIN